MKEFIRKWDWFEGKASAILLGIAVTLAFYEVLSRYFFHTSVDWSSEIILFLVAYILAVGPGDWWILRSLGRRYTWTWLTVPLWSLLFCGILYAVTAYKRGGDLTVRGCRILGGSCQHLP